jgi:hypothetical protein
LQLHYEPGLEEMDAVLGKESSGLHDSTYLTALTVSILSRISQETYSLKNLKEI